MKTNKKAEQVIFSGIIAILKDLHKKFPTQSIARHLADATADYKNIWVLENKELFSLLEIYKTELELNIVSDIQVKEIIEDATQLDTSDIFNEDPEEDNEINQYF